MRDLTRLGDPFLLRLLDNRVDDLYVQYANLRQGSGIVRDVSGIILVTQHYEVTRIIGSADFALVGERTLPSVDPALRARLHAAGYFDVLMFREGASQRVDKLLMLELFSSDRLGRVRTAVESEATEVLQRLRIDTAFDIVSAIAKALPIRMMMEVIGLERPDALSVVTRSRMMAKLLSAAPLNAQDLPIAIAEFESLTTWMYQLLIDPYGGSPVRQVLSNLLRASSLEHRRRIIANLLVMLVTGYDTSWAMLANAAAALVTHPEAIQQLRADPALVRRAVDELIRFDTPGQVVFRHALKDTMVRDCRIRAGEMLALLIGSANHDEAVYEHPDRLDFNRSKGRSLAFGAGPHSCIGVAIAKIQLTAFVDALLPYLPHLVLNDACLKAAQHGLIRAHEHLILRGRRPSQAEYSR